MNSDNFTRFVKKYDMLPPGARVLCAVSGGADSVCLLHLLSKMPEITVVVAHFNHCLRGAESDGDEAFVRAFCAAGRRSFSEDVLREKRFRIPSARRGACFRVQSAHWETDGSAFREQTVLSARTGRFRVK